MVKGLERRCKVIILTVLGAIAFGYAALHSLDISDIQSEAKMPQKYYYAYWTISKRQSIPHIVIPDSIGHYKKMEDQFEYFVGQNDHLGRLVIFERWMRNRTDISFPVPEVELDIDQRRYFKILKDNRIEEIDYMKTQGHSQYLLFHKYVATVPWSEGKVSVRKRLVTQYMYSKKEYIYKGDERNASRVIEHDSVKPSS